LILAPEEGVGGCAPIPKKLKPLSIKIAPTKLHTEITITRDFKLN
jgi:hypothetical protein